MIITLLLFILILGLTVLVHEFGHFIFAKIFKVKVFEFSIGMGPKVFQHEAKDGTKYSLRWIPIGGYVALAGEDPDDVSECKKGERLPDKPVWQRCIIMVMGVVNNFIFAIIILFFSGLIFGSNDLSPIIGGFVDGYPAAESGLEINDEIIGINGRKVSYVDDISLYFTLEDLSQDVSITVLRDGVEKTFSFKANKETLENGAESYVIGIELNREVQNGFVSAVKYAFAKAGAIFKQMFVVLGSLFTGKLSINQLSGPVGIYSVVGEMRSYGVNAILYLMALLCINVGVINILPFPAFDGGRVVLTLVEKIVGKKIPEKVENIINTVGFILLIVLMIYVTFNDIMRLF